MCTQLFPMQSVRSVSAEAELAASVPAPSASVLASNALVVSRLMSYMWLLLFLRAIPSPDVAAGCSPSSPASSPIKTAEALCRSLCYGSFIAACVRCRVTIQGDGELGETRRHAIQRPCARPEVP